MEIEQRIPEPPQEFLEPKEVAAFAQESTYGVLRLIEVRFVKSILDKLGNRTNLKILDLGTGPGLIPFLLKKARPEWKVSAVDYSPLMLKKAQSRALKHGVEVNWIRGDAAKTPFRDAEFDVIISHLAFHEFPDPRAALKELQRISKPGAVVVIQDLCRPYRFMVPILKLWATIYYLGRPVNRRQAINSAQASYTKEEWEILLKESGLTARVKKHWPFGLPTLRIENQGSVLKTKFYVPIKNIVGRIGELFAEGNEIVQVKGFPLKVFCFRNPEHIKQILQDPNVGQTKCPMMLARVKYVMRKGGYIQEGGEEWKERRRLVQETFKNSVLPEHLATLGHLTASTVNQLPSSHVDMAQVLQTILTQGLFKIFFSTDIAGEELAEIRDHTIFIEKNFVRPLPLFVPTLQNLRFRRSFKSLTKTMLKLVRDRRAGTTKGNDLLSGLIGLGWPDQEIVDEIFSIYFGASVMSTSLSWALRFLALHPEFQEKAARPDYAAQVLNETLRLYPPSWGYPRFSKKGMEIGGITVPPRSLVIPMVLHAQRHPDYWKNPDVFNPDRFSAERMGEIHPYAYFPYGRGPRVCLGANLAPVVMKMILSSLLSSYRFEPSPTETVHEEYGFEIHPQSLFLVFSKTKI